MEKQFTVNQHWVPQFYLRHFAAPSHPGHLIVTETTRFYEEHETSGSSASTTPVRRKSIKKIAALPYLYSGIEFESRTNELEDTYFGRIENEAARVIRRCIDGTATLERGSADRSVLIMFLTTLHLRHPRMVALSLSDLGREFVGAPPLGPNDKDIRMRAAFRELQLKAPRLAPMLDERVWFLYRLDEPELVTSDSPFFVTEGAAFEPSRLDVPYSTAFIPLSPRHLLCLFGRDVTWSKPASDTLRRGAGQTINRFIINYSERFVYSAQPLAPELARDASPDT